MIKTKINNVKPVKRSGRIANVLIVDNDFDSARTILEVLARKGIRGIIANDKQTATDFLDKANYDLAFINNKINRQAGLSAQPQIAFELLRTIWVNSPEMPVIMTAKAEENPAPGSSDGQLNLDLALESLQDLLKSV